MCKTVILPSFIYTLYKLTSKWSTPRHTHTLLGTEPLNDLASAAFGCSRHSDVQRRAHLAQKGPPALQVVELVSQVPQPI